MPDCLPADFWSCCQCHALPATGAIDGPHRKRLSQRSRVRRFAPSLTYGEAKANLCTGHICGGVVGEEGENAACQDGTAMEDTDGEDGTDGEEDADGEEDTDGEEVTDGEEDVDDEEDAGGEEDVDGEDGDGEVTDGEEKEDEACHGETVDCQEDTDIAASSDDDLAFTSDDATVHALIQQLASEYAAGADSASDSTPPVATESVSDDETDSACSHVRCPKCVTWRRCPCGCKCRQIIPKTRRSCDICARGRCWGLASINSMTTGLVDIIMAATAERLME